jgi:GNAT superfamily N-acetyltransferase
MAHRSPDITIECHTGSAIQPFIPDAARLRIAVFREWPYLYEGDDAYERDYLLTYSQNPQSLFVVAKAGPEVVGISTGIPLEAETDEVKAPFVAAGIEPGSVFYFGESVLLPAWRGCGIGVDFFKERERYARSLPGIRLAAFCAVDRPVDHPARPADYLPLDGFWTRRGFTKTTLRTEFSWKETGEAEASPKPLTFWIKPLMKE